MPILLRNYTISYTEPYSLDDFTAQFPTQQYATTIEEVTAAAYDPTHPCVVATEPLFLFTLCHYCGKIVAKNRREMRRNIKHRHITATFCDKTCSWHYYNGKGSPHDAHAESKHERGVAYMETRQAKREAARKQGHINYEKYLKRYLDSKRK